ncbi:hypothetical protein D3C79_865640 [compost metagenome]
MEHCPHVASVELEPILGCREQAHHVVVSEQCPFRLASGTRGIDHIGQVVWRNSYLRIGFAVVGQRCVAEVHTVDAGRNWQGFTQVPLGQQQINAAVF